MHLLGLQQANCYQIKVKIERARFCLFSFIIPSVLKSLQQMDTLRTEVLDVVFSAVGGLMMSRLEPHTEPHKPIDKIL